MNLKNACISKLASFTRHFQFYRANRLLRYIYSPDHRHNDSISTIVTLQNKALNSKVLFNVDTASYLEWYVFFYGTYEPMITNLITTLIKPGSVCIDVGANVGIHSLTMAQAIENNGKVYAFEPHPEIIKRLCENIRINNFIQIEAIQLGLSNKTSSAILKDEGFDIANKGTAKIIEDLDSSDKPTFTISTITLDEFVEQRELKQLDFIKIDVEGHESAVFEGAEKTIAKFHPIIIFENDLEHPEQTQKLLSFLESKDYQFYEIHHKNIRPLLNHQNLSGFANILAMPN